MTFDIPNVPTLRNKCLSTVAENFRNFKSKLTSRYIFGHLKRSDDYGFIDPQDIHESNDFDHINMRMISSFRRGKKIYFLPYISGRHWQLLVMSVQDNYALWFCSLHRPPPTQLRQAIDCSIPASMMMDVRSIVKSRKIAWISLKRFKTTTPVPEKSLLFIRNAAAKYIVRLYNSS
ncbi:hypothetical protein LR48_Vigan01g058600 [Vigna angularis]|uniref:Ubiquitin-like protease family profile domain-containing protein n=1 Tax=Phaseolus angularis TaxID=3914 RepID=A0A0L9TKM7_PHAAN|nr:hypothetical protein LR48_Vigan01g058600 [Vigna angularis]